MNRERRRFLERRARHMAGVWLESDLASWDPSPDSPMVSGLSDEEVDIMAAELRRLASMLIRTPV